VHSPVSDVSCVDQVNEEVARFTDMLLGAAREELPLVRQGGRPQYRDERLKALCRQSMEARKKWRENGCPTSGPLFDEKRRLRIEVRKRVKHCAVQSERRHIQQRQKLFSSRAPHRFKVPGSHSMQSKCSKLMVNGNIVSAQSELLQTWAGHFESLSKSCTDSCPGIRVLEDKVSQLAVQSFSTYEGLLDTDFSAEEVATAVARLKVGKAPGPDGLSAEHLKAGGEAVITWLCTILKTIIQLEVIPDALKVGTLFPFIRVEAKILWMYIATGG